MRAILASLAAVLCTTAGTANAAEPIGFLICQPGGPDLSAEQTEVMDRLFRYLEKKMKLSKGQFQGHYANTTRSCDAALAEHPAIIFPSVPIYIQKKRELGLKPVAQLRINGKSNDHFYVMTRADSTLDLAGLAGKTLIGTHLDSPRFLTDGVFGGKLKPDQLKLKPSKRALRAIRRVIRGKADAVVLDGTQYRALAGSRYEKELKLLHTSPLVPTPPVTVVQDRIPPELAGKLADALVGMAKDDQGRAVLKTFQIEGFEAISRQQWANLEARLHRL
ncbi:MAG: PhnD/SsuA/transferrin family substrate-binding protein [Myxococcota bacterium]